MTQRDRLRNEIASGKPRPGLLSIIAIIAALAAACTTVQRIIQPVQPVVIQRNFLVLPPSNPTPYYQPPSDIGEA